MKKQNQIGRKNSRGNAPSQEKKAAATITASAARVLRSCKHQIKQCEPTKCVAAAKRRIRVPMSAALREAVTDGARRTGLSVSKFVEVAIREKLPIFEPAAAQRRRVRRSVRGPIMNQVSEPAVADHPDALREFWQRTIAPARWFDPMKEHLVTVICDVRYRVIAYNVVSIGSLNETVYHPREILRPVITQAGYAFALMHNHPSGVASPSIQDHVLTNTVSAAAQLLKLRFLDHVIVGAGRVYFSFREAGVIDENGIASSARLRAAAKRKVSATTPKPSTSASIAMAGKSGRQLGQVASIFANASRQQCREVSRKLGEIIALVGKA